MSEYHLGRRSFLLGGATVLGAAACSNGSSGGSGGNSGSKQFTLWSMWEKGEPGQKVVGGAIDDFQKATGIKVTVLWKGRGVMTAITPAVAAGHPPTDMVENGAGMIQGLKPASLLDLSDVYRMKITGDTKTVGDVVGTQYQQMTTYLDNDGTRSKQLYMVPYWATAYGIFYNGKNYPEVEKNPPKTWPDFIKILDATKGGGKRAPLALDGSVTGYNFYYFQYMTYSAVGPTAIVDGTMDKTGQTWKKPGYLASAQLVEKLAKGGYFIKGYDASKFPAIEDKWANNEAGFLLMGSWIKGEVLPVAASGFDFQSFPYPAMSGGKPPAALTGPYGFSVFKQSKNADACKKFMAFFLQKKYQERVASMMVDIPLRPDVAAPKMLQPLKKPLDAGNINTAAIPPVASTFGTDVLYPADDKLVFGKISAEQFISTLVSDTAKWWKTNG